MARRKNTRAAHGSGSLRQRPDGRWEARFTYVDELGQKRRKSVYANTQQECAQKQRAALKAVDDGAYQERPRYTLSRWLDVWLDAYCGNLKPSTLSGYKGKIEKRIKPYIGGTQLSALRNLQIQKYYQTLLRGGKGDAPLSPKSISNIHGILHKALEQAVAAGVIPSNPADKVNLPESKKPDLKPIMDENVGKFIEAIKGDPFERLFIVALFSGLRQSELVGLRWEDVDLENGAIKVHRQIQKAYDHPGYIFLEETKNGKSRVAVVAPSVVKVLKAQKAKQTEMQLAAGPMWNNEHGLVFTDESGQHLKHRTINNHFKKIVVALGLPDTRFHDLRHSYAVNALQAGDSIKSVQEQLGHYSSAFTMDVYAAVSDTMRKASQDRMETLIKSVSNL